MTILSIDTLGLFNNLHGLHHFSLINPGQDSSILDANMMLGLIGVIIQGCEPHTIMINSNLILFNPHLKIPPSLTNIGKATLAWNTINTFMKIGVHRVFYIFKEAHDGI
jgi:hypothetical protein